MENDGAESGEQAGVLGVHATWQRDECRMVGGECGFAGARKHSGQAILHSKAALQATVTRYWLTFAVETDDRRGQMAAIDKS